MRNKLKAIQWITHNKKFNEHQLIQLGDAIAAFNDCIEENEKLKFQNSLMKEALKYYAQIDSEPIDYLVARQALAQLKDFKNDKR